ncbi:unnamed protein product [Withania somnifera]
MELTILLGVLFLVLPLLITKWYKESNNKRKLPPGPCKLPFIENLHQSSELLPHSIIVSSPQMFREVMRKHDLNISNRPVFLVGTEMFYGHADMGFCNYGDFRSRKICIQELLSHKNIQLFYPKMLKEISNLVSTIKSCASEGSPINMTETLSFVSRACKNQGSLIEIMRTVAASAGVFTLADLLPSTKIIHFIIDVLLEEIINEHEFQNSEPTEEDIVDVLLRLQTSPDFSIPITRDNTKALIIDLFAGGSTTSASTMEWAFSEIMKNPKIMKKAQDEVRQVLKGKENGIEQTNIQKFKYLKMIVKDTVRSHPLAPLLAPRESREESEINGYVILKGSMTLVNFWKSQGIQTIGKILIYLIQTHFEFTPFGTGRRICPGLSFSMATQYDWKLRNGMSRHELDMTEKFCNVLERKNNSFLIPLPYEHA